MVFRAVTNVQPAAVGGWHCLTKQGKAAQMEKYCFNENKLFLSEKEMFRLWQILLRNFLRFLQIVLVFSVLIDWIRANNLLKGRVTESARKKSNFLQGGPYLPIEICSSGVVSCISDQNLSRRQEESILCYLKWRNQGSSHFTSQFLCITKSISFR